VAQRTREAMEELGVMIGERRPKTCVVVSPHSPFLPEAFGVWEAGRLKGTMARFQAPDVTITLDVALDLAEAIVDTANRMELPVGRIKRDWELDRGVTVPALYLLKTDEVQVVPVAISMLGWEEHWLFGTAVAKAAQQVYGEVAIIASANLSHRVTEDAPHGYSPTGAEFDGRIRDAVTRGQLREFLDIPQDLCREASECGMAALLVLGGAFDGEVVNGRVLSYETPFGIGYLVAEIMLADKSAQPLRRHARETVSASGSADLG
jgi:AmmeMemoRadiSam system protein B